MTKQIKSAHLVIALLTAMFVLVLTVSELRPKAAAVSQILEAGGTILYDYHLFGSNGESSLFTIETDSAGRCTNGIRPYSIHRFVKAPLLATPWVIAVQDIDKQTLGAIKDFRSLRRLDLTGEQNDFTTADLGFLSEFGDLQCLMIRVKQSDNDDSFFDLVKQWPKLRWLSISGVKVTNECLKRCEKHPSLEVLSVDKLCLSGETFVALAEIPNLRMAVIGGQILSRKQIAAHLESASHKPH